MKINFKEKLKKWLSLGQIGFKKHPVGWVLGNLGMLIGLLNLHDIFPSGETLLFSLLSALAFGVLLSISVDLYREHYNPPKKWFNPLALGLMLGSIVLFGIWCLENFNKHAEIFWFQWWAILIVSLLLSFVAYKPNSKSIDKAFFFSL